MSVPGGSKVTAPGEAGASWRPAHTGVGSACSGADGARRPSPAGCRCRGALRQSGRERAARAAAERAASVATIGSGVGKGTEPVGRRFDQPCPRTMSRASAPTREISGGSLGPACVRTTTARPRGHVAHPHVLIHPPRPELPGPLRSLHRTAPTSGFAVILPGPRHGRRQTAIGIRWRACGVGLR